MIRKKNLGKAQFKKANEGIEQGDPKGGILFLKNWEGEAKEGQALGSRKR